jgi:hypothetical protein
MRRRRKEATARELPPEMTQLGNAGIRFARGDIVLAAGMLCYLFVAWLLCLCLDHPENFVPFLYTGPFYLSYALYTLTILIILKLRQSRGRTGDRLFGVAVTLSPRDFLTRLISALPILLATPFFLAGFTALKNLLNDTNPFTWDPALESFDRWLHFGTAPWQWLQLELWPATRVLEFVYALWGVALAAVPFIVCLRQRTDPDRMRLLISYPVVMVLLGNVAAGLFMSAGPFWFHHQAGLADPYAALFAYLNHDHPQRAFSAVLFQEYLWMAHAKNITELGTAISAFPSIHVAIAALFLFYAWPLGAAARALALAFFLVILAGSVLLGWHYAVDGYAGFAGAAAVYWTVGRLLALRRSIKSAGAGPRPAKATARAE